MASDLAASVIIPALDSRSTIGRAVSSIIDQKDARGRGVEVIVVDDGSRDDTGDVARDAGARVIRLDQRGGPARARNRGVAEARADVVIFTDADCAARAGFVAALLAPLDDPAVGATKGAYLSSQRELVARFVQLEYEERYARMAARPQIDFIDTYAAAYRKDLFLAAGGFDERYDLPSTEDQELSFRVHERGARFIFAPEARTEHLHAASLLAYARKKRKIGTFKAATLRAHPGKAVSDSHTPQGLKAQLLLAPLAVASLGLVIAAIAMEAVYASATSDFGQLTTALSLDLRSRIGAATCGVLLAFLVSCLPLVARARRDPALALAVPLLVLIRALSLGTGLAIGIARETVGGGVLEPRAKVAP
jgi:cellulose synthase/poly-beta-1,6-N-acetylglucosamine synthase-like glycosyltransferase